MYLKDTEAALQFAAADYFHQTGDNELLDYNNQYDVTTVLYRMKNGKEYYRTYYIDMAAQSDMMDRLLENEDYKKAVFRIYDEDYMVGYDRKQCYFEDVFGPKTLREEEIADLIECLKQDYTSYSYTNLRDEVEIGQISFNASDKNYIDQMSDSYAVYPFCKKTLAYLEQKGYYESDRTLLDEVKRVEITHYADDDYMNVKTENYDDKEFLYSRFRRFYAGVLFLQDRKAVRTSGVEPAGPDRGLYGYDRYGVRGEYPLGEPLRR